MAKKEFNFIINVDDSSNPHGAVRTSLSSLSIDHHHQQQCKPKSKCLSPLSANSPHSITWSSNLSSSSSHIQVDSRLFHPQLSNSFSGISGLTAALNQNTSTFKRDANCSKASLSSLANSSEGSLCVHAPSLPTLEGFRELDASGNISQCQGDDASIKAFDEYLPTSISCPSLISVGIVPSSSSRRLMVMTNVPRANSTFNMPGGDEATPVKGSVKQVYNFHQKGLFGKSYLHGHGQCYQFIGQSSLSPYFIRKTIRNRQTTSSIASPSSYKRKCEDWLGDNGAGNP